MAIANKTVAKARRKKMLVCIFEQIYFSISEAEKKAKSLRGNKKYARVILKPFKIGRKPHKIGEKQDYNYLVKAYKSN